MFFWRQPSNQTFVWLRWTVWQLFHYLFFIMSPPLNQGYGYGIVVGFGAFFSIFITILWMIERRYAGIVVTSEE
jgi:hypothetical protein